MHCQNITKITFQNQSSKILWVLIFLKADIFYGHHAMLAYMESTKLGPC